MTMRGARRWWVAGSAVGAGLAVLLIGFLLARAGLEDADRWASVIGMFVAIAGLLLAVLGELRNRHGGPGEAPEAPRGEVSNQITGGEFRGPVIMARDVHGPAFPSGDQERREAPGGPSGDQPED